MTDRTNLVSQLFGRGALLIIGTVAMICTGCHGQHRAMNAAKPSSAPLACPVDVEKLLDDTKEGGLIQLPSGRYMLKTGCRSITAKG